MGEIVVKRNVELLSTLALATRHSNKDIQVSVFPPTCYLTERNVVKFVKNGFCEKDVEAVLQQLDRLTQDDSESRTTAAQALKVVYGLAKNISVVVDGEQMHLP